MSFLKPIFDTTFLYRKWLKFNGFIWSLRDKISNCTLTCFPQFECNMSNTFTLNSSPLRTIVVSSIKLDHEIMSLPSISNCVILRLAFLEACKSRQLRE